MARREWRTCYVLREEGGTVRVFFDFFLASFFELEFQSKQLALSQGRGLDLGEKLLVDATGLYVWGFGLR